MGETPTNRSQKRLLKRPEKKKPARTPAVSPRLLLRLMRLLACGPCAVVIDGEKITLAGVREESFPRAALAAAVSRGLARIDGDSVTATPEASAFLRRALAGAEDGFAEQHGAIAAVRVEIEGRLRALRRNAAESPLGAAARLKDRAGLPFLSEEALGAGERLAADFTRAQLQPHITMNWDQPLSARRKGRKGEKPGEADLSGSALAARARFNRAVEAMGPELAGIAMDVCCFAKGLELVERERQWPARSAKLLLRAALLALARHYAPPPRRTAGSRHWGAADYRPDIKAAPPRSGSGGEP